MFANDDGRCSAPGCVPIAVRAPLPPHPLRLIVDKRTEGVNCGADQRHCRATSLELIVLVFKEGAVVAEQSGMGGGREVEGEEKKGKHRMAHNRHTYS